MSKDSKPTKKATVSKDSKPLKKGIVSNDTKPAEKSAVSNDSNASIPIVERLYCWVNGTSFSIENSQEIDPNNAEALWTGCKFVDLR